MTDRVRISPGFVFLVCGLIYLDTDGLALPFLLSCALHEAGHLLVLRIYGIRPGTIRIGLTGAVIEAAFPSFQAEILSTLAGPSINLLLCLLGYYFWPQIFLCNTVLLLYNLLPLYPLDGGRILKAALSRRMQEQAAARVMSFISCATILLVIGLCLYLIFWKGCGLFPLSFCFIILFHFVKTLVKQS